MTKYRLSRRAFLRSGAATLALAPLALNARTAGAGELQPLSPDDPMAVALSYHADATTVDAGKFDSYQAGQRCSTCRHVKTSADSDVAGCALFPGKGVALDGWCKVWTGGG